MTSEQYVDHYYSYIGKITLGGSLKNDIQTEFIALQLHKCHIGQQRPISPLFCF